MGEISKSGLRRGRGGNASPSLLYKIEEQGKKNRET